MNQKISFFLLFNLFFFRLSSGQSLENVINIANNYFQEESYTLAIKEYQRYLFFDANSNPTIYYKIGLCFKKLEQYEKASEYFDKAFFSFTQDSSKLNALYNKAECLILNRDYSLALTELLGISDTITGKNYYKREFYSAIAYFAIEDFTSAEKCFSNSVEPKFQREREQIKLIFANKRRFNKPKPKTASILSMCFPGLGQFYSGDIKNGANSILLTSTLIYLGVRIAVNQTLWDALFTIAPWYQRYYQGGYMNAEKIAFQKRANNRQKAYEEVILTIASTKK